VKLPHDPSDGLSGDRRFDVQHGKFLEGGAASGYLGLIKDRCISKNKTARRFEAFSATSGELQLVINRGSAVQPILQHGVNLNEGGFLLSGGSSSLLVQAVILVNLIGW
jgi:hypothetical protein